MKMSCLLFISTLLCISCIDQVSTDITLDQHDSTLNALLEEAYNKSYKSIAGMSAAAMTPTLDEKWVGAYGFDSSDNKSELKAEQAFRIASVTKTFVATAILRLHEMDSLSIEDPISKYISQEHHDILAKAGYQPDKILIKHCLNHTSGLFDYAMGGPKYREAVQKQPDRRWTRTEQVEAAMSYGQPVGKPGERYFYSDTGYILLGEIIELFSGGSLAGGLRSLIGFEKLGMTSTWLESLETHPLETAKKVSRYVGRIDATNFDASIDLYGGGGLKSTTSDLVSFMHALFNHQVFAKKETLDLMLTKPVYDPSYDTEKDERFKDYRYGLWMLKIFDQDVYLHKGLWGTTMLHIPAENISLATNCTKGFNDRAEKKMILTLKNINKRS